MSTVAPAPRPVMVPLASLFLRRITVDEYERLGESGALDDAERIELIDGYLVAKTRKTPGHCYATNQVLDALGRRIKPGWTWHSVDPIRMPEYNEPEQDVSIIRGSNKDYRHRHPGPSDVGLIVEVSDQTLDLDRGQKLAAYATAGIPVYWIVNLVERQVEVYTGPGPGAYQTRVDYKPGPALPLMIDGQHLGDIAVDDILP